MNQAQLKAPLKSCCSAPQPASLAAAASGVTYAANITFPGECPCKFKQLSTQKNWLVADVFYTAVNISLRARNAVGGSRTEIIHIPAESSADLEGKAPVSGGPLWMHSSPLGSETHRHFLPVTPECSHTSLNVKNKRACLQLYELQDGDQGPKEVITLTAKTGKLKCKPSEKPHKVLLSL